MNTPPPASADPQPELPPAAPTHIEQTEDILRRVVAHAVPLISALRNKEINEAGLWVDLALTSFGKGADPAKAAKDADALLAAFRKRFTEKAQVHRLHDVADGVAPAAAPEPTDHH